MKIIWWGFWMLAAGIEYLAGWVREICDHKIKGDKEKKDL